MRRAELVDELEGGSCRPPCVVAPPGVGTDLTPLLEVGPRPGRDRVRVPAVLLPVAGDQA